MVEQQRVYEAEKDIAIEGKGWNSQITAELMAKFQLVANALTIKMNDLRPWYETQRQGATNATEEHMYSRPVRVGQLVVLTHVAAANQNSNKAVQIAILRGGEEIVLNKNKTSATGYTLNFDGQAIMTEGDKVKVTFYEATVTDVCVMSCSGYEIKA